MTRLLDLLAKWSPESRIDRRLWLSSKLVRVEDYCGRAVVFVLPPEAAEDSRVRDAVVDAVHWALHGAKVDRVCVAVPAHQPQRVLDSLATLVEAVRRPTVELATWEERSGRLCLDAASWPKPSFSELPKVSEWAQLLAVRDRRALPDLARELHERLGGPRWFRWHRNLTDTAWSGRVAGWGVCSMADSQPAIRFGETDASRKAAPPFDGARLDALVSEVRAFAERRRDPATRQGRHKLEHLLESGVWSGAVALRRAGAPCALSPVFGPGEPPLQLPALFSSDETKRHMDLLLHEGAAPWCVELKVPTKGEGESYRHAVTQAVLYREFIRSAAPLHAWFATLAGGLDARRCEAAVAFPKVKGSGAFGLRETALAFGVEVFELDEELDELRARIMA